MNSSDSSIIIEPMKETTALIMTSGDENEQQSLGTSSSHRTCIICGTKAIGINFGTPTCAPCKAFFRRNARRKEILQTPCHHPDKKLIENTKKLNEEKYSRYLQIRRCTSCRLRRCFEMGMKEELIRTEEENERHKELVNMNRKRRELQKHKRDHHIERTIVNSECLNSIDWCHLSTIVSLYDNYCLKTFVEQRSKISYEDSLQKDWLVKNYTIVPMSVTLSVGSFLKALPTFQSLSQSDQNFLCKNNLRRLIFPNLHELKQSCFFEPWQLTAYQTSWQIMCGPEIYEEFVFAEYLAEKYLIADPIVTRLWMVILFFSTSLFSYFDPKNAHIKTKKKQSFSNIQNAYATLLWKYLLHRHGSLEAIRIYSSLVHTILHELRIGIEINIRLRTRTELVFTHETLDQLSTLTLNDTQ